MKSFKILVVLLSVITVVSCEQTDVIKDLQKNSLEDLSAKVKPADNVDGMVSITSQAQLPYMSWSDYNKVFGTSARSSGTAVWTEFGPYNITGTLTKVETNKKIVLFGGEAPGYGPGIYFADIWKCEASVTLKQTDAFLYMGASQLGYLAYYDGTYTEGVGVYSEDISGGNRKHTFRTYSYVLKYNAAGNPITQVVIPRDLTGTYFTYKYLRDI